MLKILETDRLIMRPFELSDAEDAHRMNSDPEVTKYTGDGGVVSIDEIRRRIKENVLGDYEKHGYGRLALIEKSSGDFIGFAGLKYLPEYNDADIGYRMIQSAWGKGYATESGIAVLKYGFEDLKLSRIIGLVEKENTASSNVLTKLGFKFEKEVMDEGGLVDLYSIHS